MTHDRNSKIVVKVESEFSLWGNPEVKGDGFSFDQGLQLKLARPFDTLRVVSHVEPRPGSTFLALDIIPDVKRFDRVVLAETGAAPFDSAQALRQGGEPLSTSRNCALAST